MKFIYSLLIVLLFGCLSNKSYKFKSWKEPVTGMEFVQIPQGTFFMGNKKSSGEDARHQVTLTYSFWIGRTEVTLKQWQKVMGTEELHPEKPNPFRNDNPDYPVVSISWFDVQHFLKRLEALSPGNHFRLPTEAEWEYACRAGTSTDFNTGDQISDDQANYNTQILTSKSSPGKYPGHPKPVGSYSPNAWGLFDMHGNAWEWVSDWYAPYPNQPVIDPSGPSEGTYKVIRGGSWYFGADNACSYFRKTHEPSLWGFSIGFRVVCERESDSK